MTNLVTNLVITKLGEEFCDIFVTLFGDSPNWVMILMTYLSPHLVGQICLFAKFGDIFGDEFSDKFGDKKGHQKRSSNLSPKSSPNLVTHQISCTFHHAIAKAAGQILVGVW